ncbi:hypothetical protein [Schlesneria paludicola]|uniref:hypothetical protein n=1 Tax=Schlesneria paludicola TaxID=360056 RepID=UPI00029A2BA9|nr:hypothetical protein [Schlesneria paludicola]
MAKKKAKSSSSSKSSVAPLAASPMIAISNPSFTPVVTNVLNYGNPVTYYVSCQGYIQHAGGKYLSKIWAKVYTSPLPSTSPYVNPPYSPDPTGTTLGYVPTSSTVFYFYGSAHSGDGNPHLVPLAGDPVTYPMQYIYVWGEMTFGDNPDCDNVTMNLAVTHITDSGDTAP